MKEIYYASKTLTAKERVKLNSTKCTSIANLVRENGGEFKLSNVTGLFCFEGDEVVKYPTAIIVTEKDGKEEKYLLSSSVSVTEITKIAEELENDFEDITFIFEYATSKSSGNAYLAISIE